MASAIRGDRVGDIGVGVGDVERDVRDDEMRDGGALALDVATEDAAEEQRMVRTSRSAPQSRASSMTASVGSSAKAMRRTGWSRSPVTRPTRSQSAALSCG